MPYITSYPFHWKPEIFDGNFDPNLGHEIIVDKVHKYNFHIHKVIISRSCKNRTILYGVLDKKTINENIHMLVVVGENNATINELPKEVHFK